MLTFEDEDDIKAYRMEITHGDRSFFTMWLVVDSNFDKILMHERGFFTPEAAVTSELLLENLEDLKPFDGIHMSCPRTGFLADATLAKCPVGVPYGSVFTLNDYQVRPSSLYLYTTYAVGGDRYVQRVLAKVGDTDYAVTIC